MIVIAGFALGFAVGWWRAEKRQGNRSDKLQYGAAHGMAFAILALFLAIVATRTGVLPL